MLLSDILPQGMYISDVDASEIRIEGLADHTAALRDGYAFLCIKGEKTDPHYLLPCLSCRPAALITEATDMKLPENIPVFFVENIRAVAAFMWNNYCGNPGRRLRLIGVTGTNGKTTTALMLTHLLRSAGFVSGYIGTLGATYGTVREKTGTMTTPPPAELYPLLSRMANAGVDTVVAEISSHALATGRVAPLTFALSVFTNLSEDHLDFHKTTENYFAAKAQLFRQSEIAVINTDDAYGARLYGMFPEKKRISYGVVYPADVNASDLYESDTGGTNYTCMTAAVTFGVRYRGFPGNFNVYNTLAAVSAALSCDLCPAEIRKGLADLPPVCGRMETVDLSAFSVPFSVMIDFAHTPEAVRAAIQAARRGVTGKLVVLFGAGGEREKEKRPRMAAEAEKNADFCFVTSDNCRGEPLCDILKDLLSGFTDRAKYRVVTDRKKAIETALSSLTSGDRLLLLGKGHETYDWGKNGLRPFSEKEIVTAYVAAHFPHK